jgi:HD-GYP domain-containing protein (c-di-GMP phosphodiesterase class II)
MALATLAYMADPSSKLDRMFGVLRTIAEFGPLAVSSSEFSSTAKTVVERVLISMDCKEGALCAFDENKSTIKALAKVGLEALPTDAAMKIGGASIANWNLLRRPLPVPPLGGLSKFFSNEQLHRFAGIECVVPLRMGGTLVGGMCLGQRPGLERYNESDLEALEMMAGHLALLLQNHSLSESLRIQIADNLRLISQVQHAQDEALEAFATTIDAKNQHMLGHSQRVARCAVSIGQGMGIDPAEIAGLRAAGHLHDIGGVIVDRHVMNKPTGLGAEEALEIANHTTLGHQIVSAVKFPWPQVPEVVRWHHERADGTGYPDRLHLQEMPLAARIIGVADTFDAMTSDRPYRKPLTMMEAARELVQLTPTKFDSAAVQALINQLRQNDVAFHEFNRRGEYLTPQELDRLSVELVTKAAGGRVYFA